MVEQVIGNKTAERRDIPIRKRDSNSTIAIRVRNVSKSFPGVQALRGINFELLSGEVHGLVGANGAGKSTFIRMLSGASQPDTGEIEIQGSPLLFEDPRLQRGMGIAAIYQELTIIPEMSVLSNAFLGKVPNRFFFTDKKADGAPLCRVVALDGPECLAACERRHALGRQSADDRDPAGGADRPERAHHGRADGAAGSLRARATIRPDRPPQGKRGGDHLYLARSR